MFHVSFIRVQTYQFVTVMFIPSHKEKPQIQQNKHTTDKNTVPYKRNKTADNFGQ